MGVKFGNFQIENFSDYKMLYWIVEARARRLKNTKLKARLIELMRKLKHNKTLTRGRY